MNLAREIEQTLAAHWHLYLVSVEDESHQHAVPAGKQSHFKVTLVTDAFQGLSLVKRHQAVYRVLSAFLETGVHALALHTYTLEEWRLKGHSAPASPVCQGRNHREAP
jgi:BolA protein